MAITWFSEKRKITDLKPYEHNPRRISKKEVARLKSSIQESGFNTPLLIDADNTIIAGHQRWEVLKSLKAKEVNVMVPERKLTDKEFQRINIQDNLSFGEWDTDALANFFDQNDLAEWGLEELFAEENKNPELKDYSDSVEQVNKLLIECINEVEQQKLYEEMTERGFTVKIL